MDNQQHRPNLLDVPVSVFRRAVAYSDEELHPEGMTTLRRMGSTSYYRPVIEAIRAEPDEARQKQKKKQLRAFTPVARLNHRKKDYPISEQVSQQWPLMMGDVDQQDNPDIDMGELKQFLTRLPYVVLCAYSVRAGLWFVVRLPDHQTPDSLTTHFRYLQKLFSDRFGVVLDKGKGGNPTHLRYVSYDADPYFNENPTVMSGQYTPPKSPPPRPNRGSYSTAPAADAEQLIARLVSLVENAGEGQRHEVLLKAARLAGGFIAGGQVDPQTAVYALETVASEWPMFSKSQKTIRDGIRYGMSAPLYPEASQPAPTAWKVQPKTTRKQSPPATHVSSVVNKWQPFDYSTARVVAPEAAKPTPMAEPIHSEEIAFEPKIVSTLDEQLANPGAILKPDESEIERFPVPAEPVDSYPAEWDASNPPDAVPTIRPRTFFEWQQTDPYFSQMGLNSLNRQPA